MKCPACSSTDINIFGERLTCFSLILDEDDCVEEIIEDYDLISDQAGFKNVTGDCDSCSIRYRGNEIGIDSSKDQVFIQGQKIEFTSNTYFIPTRATITTVITDNYGHVTLKAALENSSQIISLVVSGKGAEQSLEIKNTC